MLLLKHDDIAGLLAPEEVIAVLRDALIEQSNGLVQVPPRTTVFRRPSLIDSTSRAAPSNPVLER